MNARISLLSFHAAVPLHTARTSTRSKAIKSAPAFHTTCLSARINFGSTLQKPHIQHRIMNASDLRGYTVVLGTSSKWRRALFTQHFPDVTHTVASADIDEAAAGGSREGADPSDLTRRIARAKADALAPALQDKRALLIAMDQVVVVNGVIREKPADVAEAREYLRSYATHPVYTVTAVVVHDCMTGQRQSAVDHAKLKLRPLPSDVIDGLVAKGDVLHSAGGITVEDELVVPFHEDIEGELVSILGLPVTLLRRLMRDAVSNEQK